MKLLKIVNSNDKGGVFTCETQFIKDLTSRGISVDLVIIGQGENLSFYKSLVENSLVLKDNSYNYSGSPLSILNSLFNTYKYGLENHKAVSTHFNKTYNAIIYRRPNFQFLAGMLSKYYRVKSFWHLPGIVSGNRAKLLYTFICKRYKIIPIANSKFTKDTLGSICNNYVYPGFDEERIIKKNNSYREELKIGINEPVYGMVARVCYTKAQDLLIQGFLKSKISNEGGHLLIAGGAKDPAFLNKLYELTSNNSNVHFLGEITDLPKFYSTINVAVNSRRDAEAFGISIAEALGAGLPVIAYSLGGPPEMIENNINGWLVNSSDAESYKNAFDESIDKRNEWLDMGNKSKIKSSKFSVEFNVDKLLDIIHLNEKLVE